MIKIKIDGISGQLWQWDVNRRLSIKGIPADTEMHFSTTCYEDPDALVTKVYEEDGELYAPIPNIMLQTAGKIYVYPYLVIDETVLTVTKFQATITPRPRPSDYIYTETELYHYSLLQDRVKKLESDIITKIDEEDISAWAKEPTKPSYTAEEVGALPQDTFIPTVPENISAFENDVGYVLKEELPSLEGFATENYVNNAIANIPEVDLTPYAKREDIPSVEGLATEAYVDEAISKLDISSGLDAEITTDEEIIELLVEENMLPAVADSDGSILADENSYILLG